MGNSLSYLSDASTWKEKIPASSRVEWVFRIFYSQRSQIDRAEVAAWLNQVGAESMHIVEGNGQWTVFALATKKQEEK